MSPAPIKSVARACLGCVILGLSTASQADPISWQSLQIGTLENNFDYFGVTVANLPDGRFVLGQQGKVFVQNTWGAGDSTQVANPGGHPFDPSFVVVRDASTALIGAGSFSATSLHPFSPSSPASGVGAAIASLQNYTAAYWHSPTTSLEGWLVGGSNGPNFKHNVTFISLSGATVRTVTGELCSFSSGIAVDTGGNLFAALYELPGSADEADADKVLFFSAAQVETAIQGSTPVPRSAATLVHKFNGASTIAVDGLGRVWAGGYTSPDVQVYDPSTGGQRTLVPAHDPINGGQDIYQPARFTRAGVPEIGFLAYDSWLTGGTPVYFVHAPVTDISVPNTVATWQAFRFGAANLTPANEATLWGAHADPDHDGRENLVEYAFNTLPLSADGQEAVTRAMSGGLLAISFPRNPLNTDLTYAVEASSTLATNDWTIIATSTGGGATTAAPSGASAVSESPEGVMQRVTVTDQASAAGAPHRFLRLRLTLASP